MTQHEAARLAAYLHNNCFGQSYNFQVREDANGRIYLRFQQTPLGPFARIYYPWEALTALLSDNVFLLAEGREETMTADAQKDAD